MSLTPDKELFNLDLSQVIAVLLERLSLIKILTWSEICLTGVKRKSKAPKKKSLDLVFGVRLLLVHLYLVLQVKVPAVSYFLGQTTSNICCMDRHGSCHGLKWYLHSPKTSSFPAREFAHLAA